MRNNADGVGGSLVVLSKLWPLSFSTLLGAFGFKDIYVCLLLGQKIDSNSFSSKVNIWSLKSLKMLISLSW